MTLKIPRRFETLFMPATTGSMFPLRKNLTMLLAFLVMVSAMIGIAAQLIIDGEAYNLQSNFINLATGALGAWLVLKQRVTLAAFVIIGPLLVSLLFVTHPLPLFVIGIIILMGSAVTFPLPAFILAFLAVVARLVISVVLTLNQAGNQITDEAAATATYIILLVIVGSMTRFLIDRAIGLNRDSSRTAELLRGTSQVSQLLSGTLRQDELFASAVDAIRDRFAFYHVQIFLVDEQRQYANLVASTGETGQKLLTRGHRLAVGSKSVIGRVTQVGEPVLMRDDRRDEIHMANEFLPHTRSELALPLIDNERIIGALDVQSTRANAFAPSDVQAMQTLAGQLTTAIRNARLFEQQRENAQQNQQLLLQAQNSLQEIQRLNMQMTRGVWEQYLNEHEDEVGVKIEDEKVVGTADWTTEMIEAALAQRVTTRDVGNRVITAVPILLRGELLGVIEVEGENIQDEDVVEMVQSISQNLAITLDSVRLLEEVQSSAAQEQRISAIVDRYQSAASVDELMKVTLDELAQTLGAEQGTIRLSAPRQRSQTSNGHTVGQTVGQTVSQAVSQAVGQIANQTEGQADEQTDSAWDAASDDAPDSVPDGVYRDSDDGVKMVSSAPGSSDSTGADTAGASGASGTTSASNGSGNGSNGSQSGPADRRNGNISHD